MGEVSAADPVPALSVEFGARRPGPVLEVAPDTTTPPPDRHGLVWLVAFMLAMAAVILATGRGLIDPHDQYDLRIYFGAVNWWAHGNDLYSYGVADPVMGLLGFTYPPFAAVLMAPMATLGWRAVQGLTIIGIFGAGIVMVHFCLGERFRVPAARWWPVVMGATALAFLLQPWRQTLGMGQINLFLAVLVLADVLVLARQDSRWAGVGVGLAMAIKLVPGVFLIYFAVTRQWRSAVVALTTCGVAWLLGAIVAPAATWEYFTSLIWDTGRVGLPSSPSNQSLYGLVARALAPSRPGLVILAVVAVPVAVLAVRRLRRAAAAGDALAGVTITGLLGVLLCPVSWIHHCVWVLPALIAIGHRCTLAIRDAIDIGRVDWRQLAVPAGLLLSGLLVLVPDTRAVFDLPFDNLVALTTAQVVLSSLPMLWMLVAMLALPILQGLDARVTVAQPAQHLVGVLPESRRGEMLPMPLGPVSVEES
jgi:alpha-1,2-mannosyltransferase